MRLNAAVALSVLGVTASVAIDKVATVQKQGQSATVKLEHVLSGHLTELNGRYKLRVTEVTYDPDGYIGEHHHAGPGIRCVTVGELVYVQPDQTSIYHPGDCFYESGDLSHTAHNRTKGKTILLNFELLPASWKAGSAIPVPSPLPGSN